MTDISNQTDHIEEAIQPIEVVKRPRGRPTTEKQVQPKEKKYPKEDHQKTNHQKNHNHEEDLEFMKQVQK